MKYPKVSCICPTFGRAYLLEEALESFHKQDYPGEKELIICNDFVHQEILYTHPDVTVVNLETRCPNLGSKRNKAYSYATGELFLTWGDDDIHLPSRISRMVKATQTFNSEFVYEGPYYILYGGKIYREKGKTSGAHIISKDLFYKAGAIPEINSGEDQAFNKNVKLYLKKELPVCVEDPQFLYRFSTGRAHVSQYGEDSRNKKSGYEIVLDMAKQYIAKGLEPEGKYELKPKWTKDWVEEVKTAIIK